MINIQNIIKFTINLTDKEYVSINIKINEIYDSWLLENENRHLLFISDHFNDLSKLKEKITLFNNLDTI